MVLFSIITKNSPLLWMSSRGADNMSFSSSQHSMPLAKAIHEKLTWSSHSLHANSRRHLLLYQGFDVPQVHSSVIRETKEICIFKSFRA
jgi:hypothetical protein